MRDLSVTALIAIANNVGIEPEDLDEVIYEQKSIEAASINNGGLEEQLAYLEDRLGPQEALKVLQAIQNEKERT